MKLYFVERKDETEGKWDIYENFVVAAENEDEALKLVKFEVDPKWDTPGLHFHHYRVPFEWVPDYLVSVTLVAEDCLIDNFIVSAYKAG